MKQHETEKENGYWMPDYIGTDMNLLLSEKVVLGIIVQYYKKYKKCFLGNDYFMPYLSTQRDATVSETLKSLAKKGYITIEKGNGKRLLIPIPEGFEKHFEITDSVKNDKKEVTDSVKSFTDSVKEVTDSVKKITLSVTEYNSNYKEKNIEKKTSPYPQISEEEEGFKKVKILESEAGNDEMEAMIKFILDFFKSVKSEDKAWLTKQIKKIEAEGHLEEFTKRTRSYIRLHRDFEDKVGKYKTTMRKYITDLWCSKDWTDYYKILKEQSKNDIQN